MIPRCDGIVGGKVAHGCAASPSRMGRFETRWLTTAEPIGACRSFRPMDRQGSSPPSAARRRARHGFERQPDARQTGAERLELWNGHYEWICYHPLFVFNQFGDLERCALRPSNVPDSADEWEGVLKPVVARYQGKVSRIYFPLRRGVSPIPRSLPVPRKLRASSMRSGFRPTGFYRIRSATCSSAQSGDRRTKCAVPMRTHQAGTWTKPRRVVAKVEWHPGELLPARRFHRHQHGEAGRECRGVLQQARDLRAVDQGGQGSDPMDAAFVPLFRRQRRPPSASCPRLQSRQPPAHARHARADQRLVAHEPQGETHQDWREGREPWALCRAPDR